MPVSQKELYVPALTAMSKQPNGYITTTELIAVLEKEFQPTGKDAEKLKNRNDTHFSQKVRNIVSHWDTPGNPIREGYAERIEDEEALQITAKGLAHLKSLGY